MSCEFAVSVRLRRTVRYGATPGPLMGLGRSAPLTLRIVSTASDYLDERLVTYWRLYSSGYRSHPLSTSREGGVVIFFGAEAAQHHEETRFCIFHDDGRARFTSLRVEPTAVRNRLRPPSVGFPRESALFLGGDRFAALMAAIASRSRALPAVSCSGQGTQVGSATYGYIRTASAVHPFAQLSASLILRSSSRQVAQRGFGLRAT